MRRFDQWFLRKCDFRNILGSAFADGIIYNYAVMRKSAPKPKSAMDTLIDSVCRIRSEAKERMSEEEFRQAEEKFNEIAAKVRASRGRKRETA